jgi:hypothetical protein
MKLIFSRKGFDSSLGKVPSPILPDGRMIHVPIPSSASNIMYKDLHFDELNLGDIVYDITDGRVLPTDTAHVDPDLNMDSLQRKPGWQPLFGQAGAAQGHLMNQNVTAGDIFLFFGWFQETDLVNNKLEFNRRSKGVHAIFGWLQVEKTISVGYLDNAPTWATYHPHLQRAKPFKNDTVYVSTEQLTLPHIGTTSFPGAAIFKRFSNRLQLTKDQSNRSIWELPGWFFPKNGHYPLTYHSNPDRWQRERDKVILSTVGRGQEFVLDTTIYPEAIAWFRDLLNSDFIEFAT